MKGIEKIMKGGLLQTEHRAKLEELDTVEWLREDVGGIIRSSYATNFDVSFRYALANPMVATIDLFHRALMFRIANDLRSRVAVEIDRRRPGRREAKFFEESALPHDIASDDRRSDVLGLSGRKRDSFVKLRAPINCSRAHHNCESAR